MEHESLSWTRKIKRLLEQEGGTVEGKCPENHIVGDRQLISAFGKSKEEAHQKIVSELRKRAEKLRKDKNSPCTGDCHDTQSECILIAAIDDEGFSCYPATSPSKGDGWICVYDGIFGAECFCPDFV
jgi:hypothetical protein